MRTRTDVQATAGKKAPGAPAVRPAGVLDLRGRPASELRYPLGDLLVVSGLPGSGKSTLMRRVVPPADGRGTPVRRVDSQDARERLERRMPAGVPYAAYRPFARLVHYASLRRALRSDVSVVVHDCGQRSVVRRWLAREARRRGGAVHVVLLAVDPATALAGQAARGRGVSAYAFARHRRAMARLTEATMAGRLPAGAASVTVLDRQAADALRVIGFG
ncbi:AAA family ATPase [Streptomyces griseocarneus]|uniref:AAA family ATPase n=1 Tax=Streptomyces griseocarneus TaxID=51201 RepID=UPI00198FCC4E|nr:ATP-binding protein [Streptomyces griseocarneus]